ncbi:programmed cell death protein 7 [Heterodontus francisci]|uniref:programmed cell death protein 7 n=1 Tax=Heterodontus francisci TaxID=7792 RepID=UPI00355B1522
MERLPPFYAGLPERRHGQPLPSTVVLTPQNQGRDSFYNSGSRSEEKSSVAFPFPRQHGYPIPERGLARGDWRPASPAETCLQSGGDRKAPGGPAATMGRVEPVEEPSRQQQWDQGHRDHLRNYPPHPQGHKHLQCPPQPWVRAHPPHPQGPQHRDHPPHPQGQQHRDHPPHPQGQQHRDHPPHPQGQQHRDLPPHPQGQQHLDHMPHSQGHERAPHPWDHDHQGQPPHLQDYPPLPQGHEQKEYLPHLQAYECRDQASLPQGFSHQDRSAHQYQEQYPQQGQPYRCPQPPYQHKHLDSQQQYPFREHLHPAQSALFSERAGVANNVPPHIHSVPSHSENSSCQNHTLLPGGILNLPAGYGPQSSQLINHSHNIHSNQQNFPNSSGEISSWRNEHRMQSNNEKMETPWPNVPDFSQSLKDVSVEQLHRNDSMTRRPSPDQFSQSFKCNEPLKEQDELWLMRFLSKRRLQSCKIKKPKSFPLVSEVKESVLSACKLVTELTALCQQLRHNVENEAVWSESYLKAIEIKTALQVKLKTLSDGDYLNAVKKKLERIKKKRSSIQRKKQEWRLEKQEEAERAAEKEAKIDEWRMKRVREVEDKKRERELKAAADSVLSEVRKKQADAKRLVDILRAIEKLRKLRKEAAARKGVQPPPSADETFEHHVERLRKLIKKRSDVYDAEERALRVMLEGEQEEERKRENEKKLKKEREKLEKQQREVESMMFGDPELPSDHPLQPFRQYYLQAEHSSHVLVQIRQEWDRYLVPGDHPDGSSIPQGWVFPHPPSSDTWATALKQNES